MMTQEEIKTALQGRRLHWGAHEPFIVYSDDTIAHIEYDSLTDTVWLGFAEGLGVFISRENAERLITEGKCRERQYTYTLRPRKEGE